MMLALTSISPTMTVLRKMGTNRVSTKYTWMKHDICSKGYRTQFATNHILKTTVTPLKSKVFFICYVPCRTLIRPSVPKQNSRTKFVKDGVSSKDFILIYQSSMGKTTAFFLGVGIVFMTVMAAFCIFLIQLTKIEIDTKRKMKLPLVDVHVPEVYTHLCLATGLFFGPLLCFGLRLSQVSVIRIYHNKEIDRFLGVVKRNLLMNKKIEFSMEEVKPLTLTKWTPVIGNVAIKGRKCFVTGNDFTEMEFFNRMLQFTHAKQEKNDDLDSRRHSNSKQTRRKEEYEASDKKRIQQ